MIINEVVLKEKEKFDFDIIGIDDNKINDAIFYLNKKIGNKISSSRESIELIRDLFYKYISFGQLIEKAKADEKSNKLLERYLLGNTSKYLIKLYNANPKALLDKEFNTKRTVSYLLTQNFFSIWYDEFSKRTSDKINLKLLNDFFYSIADNTFPLSFETYYAQLGKDDREFWDRTAELLFLISKNVTNRFNNSFIDEADQVVPETYEILKKSVDDGKKFNDVKHFKGHIWLICKNKLLEYMREEAKASKTSTVDLNNLTDSQYSEEYFSPFDEEKTEYFYDYKNINIENKQEVSMLIAIVLSDKTHPLYPVLLKDDEEKINLLIDIAVNEMSYDEIIDSKYANKALNEQDRKKLNAKLRQDYVRIRKKIVEKMQKILKEI